MPILSDPTLVPARISTTVLPGGIGVVVDTSQMATGGTYRVTGSTPDGLTWPVRGGVGTVTGQQLTLVDVMAPLNTQLIYRVTDGVGEWSAYQVVRPHTGWHVLESLDGLIVVDVLRRDDGDERSPGVRQVTFDISGVPFPAVRYDRATAGSGAMKVRTNSPHSARLQSLVDAGRPFVALHNPKKCPLPECDVPLAQLVLLTGASNRLAPRRDRAEREWDLSYLLVADPEPNTVVPVTTWDEWDAYEAGRTWATVDADVLTWDQDDRLYLVDGAL